MSDIDMVLEILTDAGLELLKCRERGMTDDLDISSEEWTVLERIHAGTSEFFECDFDIMLRWAERGMLVTA